MISAEPYSRRKEPDESLAARSNRIGPTKQAALHSQIGRILCDRYRLEAEIGSGSMGKVYQAADLKLNLRVAVKLVLPDARSQLQAHLRIANEAKITSRLYHPNIVSVQQFHRDTDGTELLVLELLEGVDLREYLSLYGRMALPRALAVLRCLGSALQYAHELGVAHCDIKPENVFLGRERTAHGVVRDTVKLLDFGLARLFREAEGAEKQDALGQALALGTAEYLAPELLKEGVVADARTDQWSLAVLAYEILSGQLPFKGLLPDELRRVICRVEPRPLAQLVPQLPGYIERAVNMALAKEPTHRFATIGQFLNALENPVPSQGDTLGPVRRELRVEDTAWVHREDLTAGPTARPSDVLQTVQYSADELFALARQSLAGMSNVPQAISEDSPTKPYLLADDELRGLTGSTPPAAVLVTPPSAALAIPIAIAPAESSLPAISLLQLAQEARYAASDRETCVASTEDRLHTQSVWLPSPRRTRWFTIGAGSALFCLGFLMALILSVHRPRLLRGDVYKRWTERSTVAEFYEPPPGSRAGNRA